MMYFDKIQFLIVEMILAGVQSDPAGDQLSMYKNKTSVGGTWTTSTGKPLSYCDTRTLNKNLLRKFIILDSLVHMPREVIPLRVVHTKGAGAFGYFEVTKDVTNICKANFLNKIGKRTKISVRFSVSGDRGTADTIIDNRGFAVKFYTEEGNFDLVGLNTDTFSIKDPIDFESLIRSTSRNPATNFNDPTMKWDFLTLRKESFNTFLFDATKIPNGYRHMPGYGIHTFRVVNEQGEKHFVRFHILPDQGIKNVTVQQAVKIGSDDPDYNSKDLYNAIANSDYPTWTVSLQVLTVSDVKRGGSDIFDITKRISLRKFPLVDIGRITLNENPLNYHAQVEQLAFNPFNLVPGIDGGIDSVFEARGLAYNAANSHRLGSNFHEVLVNCPLRKPLTYIRNGYPPVSDNMKDAPNYTPNSFNGPIPHEQKCSEDVIQIHQDEPNNLDQARDFYLHGISESERKMIIESMAQSLSSVPKFIQDRALGLFKAIDRDLYSGVQIHLQENAKK